MAKMKLPMVISCKTDFAGLAAIGLRKVQSEMLTSENPTNRFFVLSTALLLMN
jgi:hypothetical protein